MGCCALFIGFWAKSPIQPKSTAATLPICKVSHCTVCRSRAPRVLEGVWVLQGTLPLVSFGNRLVGAMPVERGPCHAQEADVVEILSVDICVSVESDDDDRCPVCSVDSEHVVNNPVVISPFLPVF